MKKEEAPFQDKGWVMALPFPGAFVKLTQSALSSDLLANNSCKNEGVMWKKKNLEIEEAPLKQCSSQIFSLFNGYHICAGHSLNNWGLNRTGKRFAVSTPRLWIRQPPLTSDLLVTMWISYGRLYLMTADSSSTYAGLSTHVLLNLHCVDSEMEARV